MIDESFVLCSILKQKEVFDQVFPFLSDDLFSAKWSKYIFNTIKHHHTKYNTVIKINSGLQLKISQTKKISENVYQQLIDFLEYCEKFEEINDKFIIDSIEEYIKNKMYYNAVIKSTELYDEGTLDGDLPKKIENALSFTFDKNIGLKYSDVDEKFARYTDIKKKIPFKLDVFNEKTDGGCLVKTLNVLMSSESGAGKTLTMCHLAADYIRQGYHVLYITMEIAEEQITARIDANILSININQLSKIKQDEYNELVENNKVNGTLFVKEYPAGSVHTGHFRYLLKELKMKHDFTPDVIFIDYLGITNSQANYKPGDTYGKLKNVSEELRGLSQEGNYIIWSAIQSNRGGQDNVDITMAEIAESGAINHTVDFMCALVTNESLNQQNALLFKILKNRYSEHKDKFTLGINKSQMKLIPNCSVEIPAENKKENYKPTYTPKNTIGLEKKKISSIEGWQ